MKLQINLKKRTEKIKTLPDKAVAPNGEMKIDPSIFVSLKKGSISTSYKIGEVLGEGKKNIK